MAKTKTKTEPLLASEAKQLDYVPEDNGKSYVVTFQLGSNRRWGTYAGGSWEKTSERGSERNRTVEYQHRPAVHTTEPVSGKLVNGLISHHNSWLEANRCCLDRENIAAMERIKNMDRHSMDPAEKRECNAVMQRFERGMQQRMLLVLSVEETDQYPTDIPFTKDPREVIDYTAKALAREIAALK